MTVSSFEISTSISAQHPGRVDIIRTNTRTRYLLGFLETEQDLLVPALDYFAPTVVSPTGEHFALPCTASEPRAIAAILIAVADYTYQPHPLKITAHIYRGSLAYYGDCPTCADAGRPELPDHPSAATAREFAVRDHLQVHQMTAVLTAHPRTLAPVDPPAQTRHPLARTGDPCPCCPERLTADEARLARRLGVRTCSLCVAIGREPS